MKMLPFMWIDLLSMCRKLWCIFVNTKFNTYSVLNPDLLIKYFFFWKKKYMKRLIIYYLYTRIYYNIYVKFKPKDMANQHNAHWKHLLIIWKKQIQKCSTQVEHMIEKKYVQHMFWVLSFEDSKTRTTL